jgi:hypothetical protein
MRNITFLLLSMCAFPSLGLTQSDVAVFVNPGLKIGYTFGDIGGFTYGAELTVTAGVKKEGGVSFFYGVVANLDFCRERIKFHIGGQCSYVGGIEIGPSWIWKADSVHAGIGFSAFAGFLGYPYYSYTSAKGIPDFSEAGILLKLHFLIAGRK